MPWSVVLWKYPSQEQINPIKHFPTSRCVCMPICLPAGQTWLGCDKSRLIQCPHIRIAAGIDDLKRALHYHGQYVPVIIQILTLTTARWLTLAREMNTERHCYRNSNVPAPGMKGFRHSRHIFLDYVHVIWFSTIKVHVTIHVNQTAICSSFFQKAIRSKCISEVATCA